MLMGPPSSTFTRTLCPSMRICFSRLVQVPWKDLLIRKMPGMQFIRLPLYPGYPYSIIIRHNGDPARFKLYAMDKHPFDKVSVKMQLVMKRIDSTYNNYKGSVLRGSSEHSREVRIRRHVLASGMAAGNGENDRPAAYIDPGRIDRVWTAYGAGGGNGAVKTGGYRRARCKGEGPS